MKPLENSSTTPGSDAILIQGGNWVFLFTLYCVLFVYETWIINVNFIKSFSQCNEVHRRKSVIFEKPNFLKFGRGWPKVAGVADDGCGIVSLDNLTPFHKEIIFV